LQLSVQLTGVYPNLLRRWAEMQLASPEAENPNLYITPTSGTQFGMFSIFNQPN